MNVGVYPAPIIMPTSGSVFFQHRCRACPPACRVERRGGENALLRGTAYRERQLAGRGLTPVFPLWMRPTDALVTWSPAVAGASKVYRSQEVARRLRRTRVPCVRADEGRLRRSSTCSMTGG